MQLTEHEKYKVEVIGSFGIRIMQPIGIGNIKDEFVLVSDEKFYYDQSFQGDFTFDGDDFLYFKSVSDGPYRYDNIRFNVYILSPSGLLVIEGKKYRKLYTSFVSLRDSVFDLNKCEVKINFSVDNIYQQYDDYADTEHNLFEIVPTDRVGFTDTLNSHTVTNGMPLYDCVVNLFIELFGYVNVQSDFFQWNSTNPGYVIGNSDQLHYLKIFQQSDIVFADTIPHQDARICMLSLSDLIHDLCVLFQLQINIDSNYNVRIEHVSWFPSIMGLDLTQSRYDKWMVGMDVYSFDAFDIVKREVFSVDQNAGIDFIGRPINYDNSFTRSLNYSLIKGVPGEENIEKKNIKEYKTNKLLVDIGYMFTYSQSEPWEGVVLVATDVSNEVISLPGVLGDGVAAPDARANNILGWAYLLPNFYMHNRVFQKGTINDIETNFLSTKKIKKQIEVEIPLCDDEIINPNGFVRTSLGDGTIDKLTVDYYHNTATLSLVYEYLTESSYDAPQCVNDEYSIVHDTTLDTSMGVYDKLTDNDTGVAELIPETKKSDKGGDVEIFSDGNFTYDPPAAFRGIDGFEYVGLNADAKAGYAKAIISVKEIVYFVHYTITDNGAPIPTYTIHMDFYSDSGMTTPIDMTGRGIYMKIYIFGLTYYGPQVIKLLATGTSIDFDSPFSDIDLLPDNFYYTII